MLNKTASRQTALAQVRAGKVRYNPSTGVFADADGVVTGSRRRTFAQLRGSRLITTSGEGEAMLRLTDVGEKLLSEWS